MVPLLHEAAWRTPGKHRICNQGIAAGTKNPSSALRKVRREVVNVYSVGQLLARIPFQNLPIEVPPSTPDLTLPDRKCLPNQLIRRARPFVAYLLIFMRQENRKR